MLVGWNVRIPFDAFDDPLTPGSRVSPILLLVCGIRIWVAGTFQLGLPGTDQWRWVLDDVFKVLSVISLHGPGTSLYCVPSGGYGRL